MPDALAATHALPARDIGSPQRANRVLAEPLLVMLACLLMAMWMATTPLNHDVAWYLVSTRRWLDGAALYTDIVEVNPPLAFYETGAMLLLPLPDKIAFVGCVTGLAALSVCWSRRIIARDGRYATPVTTAVSLVILLVVPLRDFGQREHLMLIFALPWLWATALGARMGRLEGAALGAFAFLGFALKPYFLAIPALMAAAAWLGGASLRELATARMLVLGGLCGVYPIAAWLAHPAYFEATLPLGQLTYFAYGQPGWKVVLQSPLAIGAAALVVGIATRGPAATLAGGLAGAIVAYLVQFRGWNYHLLPVEALTMMVAAALILGRRGNERLAWQSAVVAAAALLAALTNAIDGPYRPRPHYYKLQAPLAGARTALLMGENVWLAYPLVQELGITHASRYPALWPLPGASILATRDGDPRQKEAQEVLRDTRRTIVDDLLATPPDVIVVDERPEKPYFRGAFDYLAFLREDPRFARAMRHYRDGGTIDTLRILRRIPPDRSAR